MNTKLPLVSVLAGMGFALSACSGEPSEGAMRDALERTAKTQIDNARASMRAMGGSNNPFVEKMLPTYQGIKDFTKLSCVPAKDEPGYICDFRISVNGGGSANAKGRFFKGPDGLAFEQKT